MNVDEIMEELSEMGSPSIKKVLMNHGAREPFFGVKVGDMKKIVKRVKKDHELSLGLYATGVSDAMYLAGLIADEKKISEKDLQQWVEGAYWYMLSEYTVPWIAAESAHGWKLGLKWIDDKKLNTASAGWSTLASVLSITPNDKLDLPKLEKLLVRVEKEIHSASNRVPYAMNCFVISAGSYVPTLTSAAKKTAKTIGVVEVEMGGTACKIPYALDYIEKIEKMGRIGRKKKMARC
jgi:3-methyladenine DNA glycosylase AlkD